MRNTLNSTSLLLAFYGSTHATRLPCTPISALLTPMAIVKCCRLRSVRELGPGSFRGTDGRIDFINQTGDLKLNLSSEYRTHLFWKFDGAAFVDAGNIWTLRKYADQTGGQFTFSKFLKQIAVSYGLGLRLNFDYFILRFDAGMKAIDPAYSSGRRHYPIVNPKFSRDFTFHFAVGLPF